MGEKSCTKREAQQRERERSIVPVLLSTTVLLLSPSLSLLGGISEKTARQQSSGYAVHPEPFPPNSKLPLCNTVDEVRLVEIRSTLQMLPHRRHRLVQSRATKIHQNVTVLLKGVCHHIILTFKGWMPGSNCFHHLDMTVAQSRGQAITCRDADIKRHFQTSMMCIHTLTLIYLQTFAGEMHACRLVMCFNPIKNNNSMLFSFLVTDRWSSLAGLEFCKSTHIQVTQTFLALIPWTLTDWHYCLDFSFGPYHCGLA